LFNDLLILLTILLTILILLVEIYRKLRQIWLRHLLSQKKKAKGSRKPPVLRPKSERDCRLCQEDKRKQKTPEGEVAIPWRLKKGKGGPKKKVSTSGYFCPNVSCEYYAITDERTHALVGYGKHGTHEEIRDF
jgi:hypothetical protein